MPSVAHHSDLHSPGDWSYTSNSSNETAGMCILCPGCGAESYLQFKNTSSTVGSSAWHWDGQRELPTLSPSVHSTGCCGWHGFLKQGQWVQ